MKHALMKLEPEVVADPKGTAANQFLSQPSLEPQGEKERNPDFLVLAQPKLRRSGHEQKRREYRVYLRTLWQGSSAAK
jgi:hypothetical protein